MSMGNVLRRLNAAFAQYSGASGVVDLNGNKLDLDADADTSITADTDDQIDIEINGADDFKFTANTLTALSGSTIATNTIAETTGASGVTIDGLRIKDLTIADAVSSNAIDIDDTGAIDLQLAGASALRVAATAVTFGQGVGLVLNGATIDPASRIVNVTASATALALTQTAHAERLVIVPIITGSGLTITLPAATGTGNKYTVLNNGVQTLSLTVTGLAGDIFHGSSVVFSQTVADSGDMFLATAADIKYTFNITTTGGIGKDSLEAVDIATDKWLVHVIGHGSGTLATGFA
jgi:hypothetical protein